MTTLITSTGNITMKNDSNVDELKWNADYDGDVANIKLNITEHETIKTDKGFHFKLTNNDLANMLSIPSVNIPIDKRLENDFMCPHKHGRNHSRKHIRKHNRKHSPNPYLFAVNMPPRELLRLPPATTEFNHSPSTMLRMSTARSKELPTMPLFSDNIQNQIISPVLLEEEDQEEAPMLVPIPTSSPYQVPVSVPVSVPVKRTRKHRRVYKTPSPKTLHMHFTNGLRSASHSKSHSKSRSDYARGRTKKHKYKHNRSPHSIVPSARSKNAHMRTKKHRPSFSRFISEMVTK